MDEIKNTYDNIFYKEDETFILLFKENCKEEKINLFQDILESEDANLIIQKN